jgi:hypothetical protein
MAVGNITLQSTTSSFEGRIRYTTLPNTSLNTTTVNLVYQVRRVGLSGSGGNVSGYTVSANITSDNATVSDDVVSYSTSSNIMVPNSGAWTTIHTSSHIVTHAADGTASISISGSIRGTVNGVGFNGSSNVTLDPIVKQAYLTSAPDFTNIDNPTIKYYNPMGNAATSLMACISFTGEAADIPYRSVSKTGSSYTFNLTAEERETLIAGTSGASRSVRFYLRMSYNGEYYYSVLHKTFSKTDLTPTLNPTIVDTNTTTVALTGNSAVMVKYYSDAKINFGAAGKEGATISSVKATCGGKSTTTDGGTLSDVESGQFVLTATDSRGATVSQTINKTLINYIKLTCNQETKMELAENGTSNVIVTISGNFFNGSFGATKNSLKLYVRHTQNNGSMGDWVDLTPLIYETDGNTYTLTATISGLDPSGTYTFQSKAADALSTATSNQYSVKFLPVFDWNNDDFNFNVPIKMNEQTVLRHNKNSNNVVLSASGGFIYFRPAGTDSTSNEIKFNPQGSIELNGDIIINGKSLKSILKGLGVTI